MRGKQVILLFCFGDCDIKKDKTFITEKFRLKKFLRMDLYDFRDWLARKIIEDSKYINTGDAYSFRIIFNAQIVEKFNQ